MISEHRTEKQPWCCTWVRNTCGFELNLVILNEMNDVRICIRVCYSHFLSIVYLFRRTSSDLSLMYKTHFVSRSPNSLILLYWPNNRPIPSPSFTWVVWKVLGLDHRWQHYRQDFFSPWVAAVEGYFADLTKNHYRDEIMALKHRWNKCISLKGDYVKNKNNFEIKIRFLIVRWRTFQSTLVASFPQIVSHLWLFL